MVITIEQALERIAELEAENKTLREELERYKNKEWLWDIWSVRGLSKRTL